MQKKQNPISLVIESVMILFIAGLLSYGFGMLIPANLTGVGQGLVLVLVAMLIIFLSPKSKIDDMKFVNVIVLLLMLIGLGSILGSLVPASSMFLLNIGDFSVTGLGFTILYIQIAEIIRIKLGL